MNYALLSGVFLVLLIFSFGVKMYTNPAAYKSYVAYRTQFSLKNEDTWYAANMFAGLLLMVLAVILLLLLIFLESEYPKQAAIIEMILLYFLVGGVIIYYMTEKNLKKNFHKDGKRRAGSL